MLLLYPLTQVPGKHNHSLASKESSQSASQTHVLAG
jgi:hypothetical protein